MADVIALHRQPDGRRVTQAASLCILDYYRLAACATW